MKRQGPQGSPKRRKTPEKTRRRRGDRIADRHVAVPAFLGSGFVRERTIRPTTTAIRADRRFEFGVQFFHRFHSSTTARANPRVNLSNA
jgi:hypothetical protein